jgi:hypothetical protein
MTGDHHDRTARRATLLVTAAAEILGTHSHGPGMAACPDDKIGHALAAQAAQDRPDLHLAGALGGLRRVVGGLEPGAARQVAGHRGEAAA